jgi:hypothetical protein
VLIPALMLFKTGSRPALRTAALSAREGSTYASCAAGMHEQTMELRTQEKEGNSVRRTYRGRGQCVHRISESAYRRHILIRMVHALGSHPDATNVVSRVGRWWPPEVLTCPPDADVRTDSGSSSMPDVMCCPLY